MQALACIALAQRPVHDQPTAITVQWHGT